MLDYSGSSDVFLTTEELSELFHEVVQNVPLHEAAFLRFLKSRCGVPDDQIADRSYPLLAARELLQQFIRDQVHEHQAA